MTQEKLEKLVRDSGTLIERLRDVNRRIGRMCSEGRPPKMTIPVSWDDDVFFIGVTLRDAIAAQQINAADGAGGDFKNIVDGSFGEFDWSNITEEPPSRRFQPLARSLRKENTSTKYDNKITDYAFKYYMTGDGLCSLCGQSGIIHTEGIRSPAGVITGRANFCICPNGQTMRESGLTPDRYAALWRTNGRKQI